MRSRTVQPGLSFEYILWIFTRLSGLGMILLAVVGGTSALLMRARTQMDLPTLLRWMFFQNPNHVVNSSISDIAQGWSNAFWQTMEMLTIFLAITHGFNGLRVVLEDYFGPSSFRPLMRGAIIFLWLAALIIAVYVILAA